VLKDGAKMSKSLGNVVSPDTIIEKYGVDTARLFILFAAPPERDLEWNDAAVEGCYRFLNRVWRLFSRALEVPGIREAAAVDTAALSGADRDMHRMTHVTVKRVTEDIAVRFQFNTAISAIMEMVNAFTEYLDKEQANAAVVAEAVEKLAPLLAPFVPHIAEEIWMELGHGESIHLAQWPDYSEAALAKDSVEIVLQINGKIKARLEVPAQASQEELIALAESQPGFAEWTAGKTPVKKIAIPGKLVNIVVK